LQPGSTASRDQIITFYLQSGLTQQQAEAKADHLLSAPATTNVVIDGVQFPNQLTTSEMQQVVDALANTLASQSGINATDFRIKVVNTGPGRYKYIVDVVQKQEVKLDMDKVKQAFLAQQSVVALSSLPTSSISSSVAQKNSPPRVTTVSTQFTLQNPLSTGTALSDAKAAYLSAVASIAGVSPASISVQLIQISPGKYSLVAKITQTDPLGAPIQCDPSAVKSLFVKDSRVVNLSKLTNSNLATSQSAVPQLATTTVSTKIVLPNSVSASTLAALKAEFLAQVAHVSKVTPGSISVTATENPVGTYTFSASISQVTPVQVDSHAVSTFFRHSQVMQKANGGSPPVATTSIAASSTSPVFATLSASMSLKAGLTGNALADVKAAFAAAAAASTGVAASAVQVTLVETSPGQYSFVAQIAGVKAIDSNAAINAFRANPKVIVANGNPVPEFRLTTAVKPAVISEVKSAMYFPSGTLSAAVTAKVEAAYAASVARAAGIPVALVKVSSVENPVGSGKYILKASIVQPQKYFISVDSVNSAFVSNPDVVAASSLASADVDSGTKFEPAIPSVTTVHGSVNFPNTLTATQRAQMISAYKASVASVSGVSPANIEVTLTTNDKGTWNFVAKVSTLTRVAVKIDTDAVNRLFVASPDVVKATSARASDVQAKRSVTTAAPVTTTVTVKVHLSNKTADLESLKQQYLSDVVRSTGLSPGDIIVTATRDNTGRYTFVATISQPTKISVDAAKVGNAFSSSAVVLQNNKKRGKMEVPTFAASVNHGIAVNDLVLLVVDSVRQLPHANQTSTVSSITNSVVQIGNRLQGLAQTYGLTPGKSMNQGTLVNFLKLYGMDASAAAAKAQQIFTQSKLPGAGLPLVDASAVIAALYSTAKTLTKEAFATQVSKAETTIRTVLPKVKAMANLLNLDPTGTVTVKHIMSFAKLVGLDKKKVAQIQKDVVEAYRAANGKDASLSEIPAQMLLDAIGLATKDMSSDDLDEMIEAAEKNVKEKALMGWTIDSFDNPAPDVENGNFIWTAMLATAGSLVLLLPAMHMVDKKKAQQFANGIRFNHSKLREYLWLSNFYRDPQSLFTSKDRVLVLITYLCFGLVCVALRGMYSLDYLTLLGFAAGALIPAKTVEFILRRAAFGRWEIKAQFDATAKNVDTNNQSAFELDPLAGPPLPPAVPPPAGPPPVLPPGGPPPPALFAKIAPAPPSASPPAIKPPLSAPPALSPASLAPLRSPAKLGVAPLPPPAAPPPAVGGSVSQLDQLRAKAIFAQNKLEAQTQKESAEMERTRQLSRLSTSRSNPFGKPVLPPPPNPPPSAGGRASKIDELRAQALLAQHKLDVLQQEETVGNEKTRQLAKLEHMRTLKSSGLLPPPKALAPPLVPPPPSVTAATGEKAQIAPPPPRLSPPDDALLKIAVAPSTSVMTIAAPTSLPLSTAPPPPQLRKLENAPVAPAPLEVEDDIFAPIVPESSHTHSRALTPNAWDDATKADLNYPSSSMTAAARTGAYILALLLIGACILFLHFNKMDVQSISMVNVLVDFGLIVFASVLVFETICQQLVLKMQQQRVRKGASADVVLEDDIHASRSSRSGSMSIGFSPTGSRFEE